MARRCDVCGKQTETGNAVSHSHRKTRREWKPNLVSIKARINGLVGKVKICTKCLKADKVEKVI
ncbi:MAG: 50S ribosomal protein L28 [Spirochaetae bacterium HGW-Spirochaetae-6]|jgi:large subunit ribosomal protein L28|nr:MAG: 50S ribosomal protein L28 [Spirochaetae bacterium HGW-Spirochaetae-6]